MWGLFRNGKIRACFQGFETKTVGAGAITLLSRA
jgi:hypothetical protein